MRVCSKPGCPNTYEGTASRCVEHERKADKARGTATERGYNTRQHHQFRRAVLTREPTCRLCPNPATVADDWPISRRELVRLGLDPNDPMRGRALCASCHSSITARTPGQQGGWNART